MFNLLIIGAGQIGSRYLQGLVSVNSELFITVVDSSIESTRLARSRWAEVGGDSSQHQIRWMQSLPSDMSKIDVAMIVTPSKGRAELIRTVTNSANVRFWVLEKVLAQSRTELAVIKSAVSSSDGSWVNTPRRMMKWHQSLGKAFTGFGPLSVSYSGGLWGLACNSIHFIDLVAWWSGESLISVDTRGLDHYWQESKRAGYFEITGELVAHFSDGTSLSLRSEVDSEAKPLRIELSNGVIWKIDEPAGTARSSNGEHIDGCIEFQSQLSGRLVDNILQNCTCELPLLDESAAMHAMFLDAMLNHWNLSQNRNDDRVPIT